MENPFQAILNELAEIKQTLHAAISAAENTTKEELLTRKEYLQRRQISSSTLWREEKSGLVQPTFIGAKRYYKMPK